MSLPAHRRAKLLDIVVPTVRGRRIPHQKSRRSAPETATQHHAHAVGKVLLVVGPVVDGITVPTTFTQTPVQTIQSRRDEAWSPCTYQFAINLDYRKNFHQQSK